MEENLYPAQIVSLRAEQAPDGVFLLYYDQQVTYGQLEERVRRAANGLTRLGVKAGDGVAIMMPNRPEWLYAFFATQRLGAYAVPVNIALRGEGLSYILNHSEVKLAIVGHELMDQFGAVRSGLSAVKTVVLDSTEAPSDYRPARDTVPFAEVMDAPAVAREYQIDPQGISQIMYTSGTTGLPKGVVTRYRTMNVGGALFARGLYRDDDILYTCLPLFHGNALWLSTLRALANQLTMGLGRRFSASRFWNEVRHYHATTFNALGAMIPILLKQPPRDDDADNPIRLVLSAATPAWAWEEFERRFKVTIVEGYGAVDGGGFSLMNVGQAPKGSMGKPPPGVEAKVVDDDGNEVATGEVGNLVFKIDNPQARRVEYFKNPEASAAKVRRGWFNTGDMAYRDAEGNFYFADRKTDSMRRRGENISSYEVEKIINQHPAVLDSAAYGVPSELGEDDVMVAVVLKPGQSLTPEELISFCSEKMAKFMVPRYVDFRESLPRTETHRVRKAMLKQLGVTPGVWDREKGAVVGPA